MIIDFHCHAGRGDLLTAPWNTAAPMESYLRRALGGVDAREALRRAEAWRPWRAYAAMHLWTTTAARARA